MPAEQHLSMGQQFPALVTNWEPWAKVSAVSGIRSKTLFSPRSGSSDPAEFSAYLGNCNPSVAARQRCKILSPCKLVLQPELSCKASGPTDRRLSACTAGSSTHTAGATISTLETPIFVFCSFPAPSVSLCSGFFLGTLFPTQQSAALALDRRSLYIIFAGAVLSHAD